MKQYTSDVHSYVVFANIDKRDGNIDGHLILLTPEKMEAIENIILSGSDKLKVKSKPSYKLEKGDKDETN